MDFRPIQPAPPTPAINEAQTPTGPSEDAPPSRKRARNVVQACDTCRKAKIKCDGKSPSCTTCISKNRPCGYSSAGRSHTRARLDTLEQIVATIQTSPMNQVNQLVQRLRSSHDPEPGRDLHLATGLADAGHGTLPVVSPESLADAAQTLAVIHDPNQRTTADSTSRKPVQADCHHDPAIGLQPAVSHRPLALTRFLLPNASLTKRAMDSFFGCSGKLFQVFTEAQALELYHAIYDSTEGHTEKNNAQVGCLMAVAAVGAQYMGGDFPQEVETDIYDLCRHHFEVVVDKHPLNAIKLCALLAQYNIMNKATNSLAYVEIGLGMSRMHGVANKSLRRASMANSDWLDLRKTWRTLMFFSSWLSTTLGYISGNDLMSERLMLSDMELENGTNISELVQTEMTKICILKADILRMHLMFQELSAPAVKHIMADLKIWYQRLPQVIQLETSGREDLPLETRRSILHIHLLYLGAKMLLYRRIAAHFLRSHTTETRVSILQPPMQEVVQEQTAEIALAANTSARILKLLLATKSVFKRCWLVIFQAYTTCTILLHVVAQKQLHSFEPWTWKGDMKCAKGCLSVLEFCGSGDRVAAKFHKQLAAIYKMVSPQGSGDADEPLGADHQEPDASLAGSSPRLGDEWPPHGTDQGYLFHIPAQADPLRVNLALSLFLILSQPFGEPSHRVSAEANTADNWLGNPARHEYPHMAVPLDWGHESRLLFRWDLSKLEISFPSASGAVVGIDAPPATPAGNVFIGSTQPSGWAPALGLMMSPCE